MDSKHSSKNIIGSIYGNGHGHLKQSPTTTNAVERKNRDYKLHVVSIKQIMTETYKIDKVLCMKHITAQQESNISYRSKTAEAKAAQAKYGQQCHLMRSDPDEENKFGPPDKAANFKTPSKRKPSASILLQAQRKVA